MSDLPRPQYDYERLPRTSLEAQDFPELKHSVPTSSWLSTLSSRLPGVKTLSDCATYTHLVTPRRKKRSILRAIYYTVFAFPYFCAFLVLVAGIFFPSYTNRPAHYLDLQQRAEGSTDPGRANPYGEKIFIAASLYEDKGQMTSGGWGKSVLQLIDLLGPDNVHLSIYEDNPTDEAKQSLDSFRQNVTCRHPTSPPPLGPHN
jgi:ZIP family zinc transporter